MPGDGTEHNLAGGYSRKPIVREYCFFSMLFY